MRSNYGIIYIYVYISSGLSGAQGGSGEFATRIPLKLNYFFAPVE